MAPRLDTPLSRALLAAGALDPSALEEAVQEQVIHGGALDTLLLERGAVDERTLADLLSKAWNTGPVDLAHIEKPAAEAVRALPERMALAMKICPYALEGTAVHVMCAAPLDRALIEEVSALLVKPLVPHVVPEVRLWQALQRAYGTPPDERYIALLTDLNVVATPAEHSLDDVPLEAEPGAQSDVTDPGAARWDLVEALAHLAAQESRDGIARVAVSYARKFLPFAAMVGVRGGVATKDASCVGWLRSGPAEGVAFLNKSFQVSDDSVLHDALESPSPSLGKPAITAGNASLFGWLGRRRPRTFLVVPIVVSSRPVGALLADGGIRARDFGSLSELVAFAARLGPAFEALLRQRHRQHPSLFPQAAQGALHASATGDDGAERPVTPAVHDMRAEDALVSAEERARRAAKRAQFDIHTEVTAPMQQVAAAATFNDVGATLSDQPGAPNIGEAQLEALRADAVRADAVRADAVRADAVRADAGRADAVRADAPADALRVEVLGKESEASLVEALRTEPVAPVSLPPDERPAPVPPPPLLQALPPDVAANDVTPPELLPELVPTPPTLEPLDAVPAPPPLLEGMRAPLLDGVPAPPPMLEPAPGMPRPVTMTSMPRVELIVPPPGERRDGTSPFARNYVVHRTEAPEPPAPPPQGNFVANDLSGLSGLSGLSPNASSRASPSNVAAANARIEAPSLMDGAAFSEVTDAHATAAWQGALEETVERGHQGGTAPGDGKARIFLDEEGWEDVRYEGLDGAAIRDVKARGDDTALSMPVLVQSVEALVAASAAASGTQAPAPIEHTSPLEELVDHLDALDEGTVARAKKLLLARGVDAIAALSDRFPGRLRVDPFDPGEAINDAAHLGPLVDVLAALGPAGLDAAVPHLDSRYPAHRFAAVLLFALTPDPRGIDLLRARLHDQEPRIRQLAADALAPFVAHARFESVLLHLRDRLASPLLEARRRAVQLLGGFRDVGSVPLLIALLDSKPTGELAHDAQHALRAITLQDFGVRARGWDKWWQKAKKRSRVDWLIEGLASDDRELRAIAHQELGALAGDDFGYKPDDDKRARLRAVATFQTWWHEEQKPKQLSNTA